MSIWTRLRENIESDWRSTARPEQLLPPGDTWSVWLYLAGRGAGKTRSGAEAIREEVESGRCRRVALIAPTAADARDVMLEGPSGILTIYPPSARPLYEPTKRRVTFKNGAIATLFSAEEPERLRGPEHDLLWADELAAWPDARAVWDQAMFGLRAGKHPRAIVTTTPRPLAILKELLKRDDVHVTRGSTYDNRSNLAPKYFENVISRYAGTRLGRQEINAEVLEDTPGALWRLEMIDDARIKPADLPPLTRIVIGLDPAMTVSETSNATGIVVGGIDGKGHAYILEDASGKYQPVEWARKAVELYHRRGADRVIAEVNQGGSLVESTIRMIDPNVAYRGVSASKNKIARAEPVSALYEQKRVHHVGGFPELEDSMCSYEGGGASPDRLDALVWALTELLVENRNSSLGFLNFYASQAGGSVAVPGGSPLDRVILLKPPVGCGGAQLASGRSVTTWGEPVEMLESDGRYLIGAGWTRVPANLST